MRNDPNYDSQVLRLDGMRPFNKHLWPLDGDWFWANRDLGRHIDARWNFHVIALADGRWSIDMAVYSIEANDSTMHWLTGEGKPRRVVFPTRNAALRASAAKMIRQARNSRRWPANVGGLSDALCGEVINWARSTVARETQHAAPMAIALRPLPKAKRPTGMPLFDCAESQS